MSCLLNCKTSVGNVLNSAVSIFLVISMVGQFFSFLYLSHCLFSFSLSRFIFIPMSRSVSLSLSFSLSLSLSLTLSLSLSHQYISGQYPFTRRPLCLHGRSAFRVKRAATSTWLDAHSASTAQSVSTMIKQLFDVECILWLFHQSSFVSHRVCIQNGVLSGRHLCRRHWFVSMQTVRPWHVWQGHGPRRL